MKNIKILTLLFLTIIGLTSCQDNSALTYIATPTGDFAFTNSPLAEYVLTPAASKNIGERFTWTSADFGVQTNVSYELQKSIIGDFSDAEVVGSTNGNDLAISIGKLLKYAAEAGLDNDPATAEPNTGSVSFRLRAFVGDTGTTTDQLSPSVTLVLVLPEAVVTSAIQKSTWGVVGSGYNNWADSSTHPTPLDAPFYTTATAGVIVSYVNLLNGDIKFRENNTWGGDLGDANLDGILDTDPNNNIAVTAGDYKITIDTNDMSYTIVPFSWGIVGSGFNNWSNNGALLDAKLYYDYTTDTFKASVKLFNGEIKFRPLNTWSGDLGDANLDGILDADANNNIAVTEGHYLVTLNLKDNSYSIVAAPVWGITGSGFKNNWGQNKWDHDGDPNTPDVFVSDAALTEIQPGVWFAENITLLDGEIKFRADNTWSGDLGDANLDNILDADPNNNIAVTAGNYVISIDFNDPDGPRYRLGKR